MTILPKNSRAGFTLTEMIIAIAIISILAGVLIPTIGNVREVANRTAAATNLTQLAKCYLNFTNNVSSLHTIVIQPHNPSGIPPLGTADNIEDVAFLLAKFTQPTPQLIPPNDANVWFIPSDPKLSGKTLPTMVIKDDIGQATTCAMDFQDSKPKAWACVIGMPIFGPTSLPPILWTYGLQRDGTWSKDSPWQGQGGHMAFIDGSVKWANKLSLDASGNVLTVFSLNPNMRQPTTDYMQAIPPPDAKGNATAKVVNADGQ